MAEGDNIVKQMTLLPEYQENFLKDLLPNIYQVDPVTKVTGNASKSCHGDVRDRQGDADSSYVRRCRWNPHV